MSTPIEALIGKTLKNIQLDRTQVLFTVADETQYRMSHRQEYNELVLIDEWGGDLEDIIGCPLIMAEERYEETRVSSLSYAWRYTFYKVATRKGFIAICWMGESNGEYPIDVSFVRVGSEGDWVPSFDEWQERCRRERTDGE